MNCLKNNKFKLSLIVALALLTIKGFSQNDDDKILIQNFYQSCKFESYRAFNDVNKGIQLYDTIQYSQSMKSSENAVEKVKKYYKAWKPKLKELIKDLFFAFVFLFVYEILYKNAVAYRKSSSLKGYYVICSQKGEPFINSPEGIPNCLLIKTKFLKPNVLDILSKDYSNNIQSWKTWKSIIKLDLDSKGHGVGYYIYNEGYEPGWHEIFQKDKKTIMVRITDLGKANLDNKDDNKPNLQLWKKINHKDSRYPNIKKILDMATITK